MEHKTVLVRCDARRPRRPRACAVRTSALLLQLPAERSAVLSVRLGLRAEVAAPVCARVPCRSVEEPERLYDREAILGRDTSSARAALSVCAPSCRAY